ncbi:uncharacterized protein M6B38_344640 [Iris pallida]|uniref:Uncharacterized protein n=1 Tax=Iris pallida TaxID=29817 RepID=A0AAX6GVY1_IRIPA|nr:uncharacterized protein M6B38_344640 [Iris pallida]
MNGMMWWTRTARVRTRHRFCYCGCCWWCDLGSWRPGVAAGQAGVFSVVVRGQGGRQAGCGLGMEEDYVSFFR